MLKIAPEGYPFVAIFLIVTVITAVVFGPKVAVAPIILTLFMVYFFRDPERIVPVEPGYISPADGRIIILQKEREEEHLKGEVMKISIFMSPMNVHVNRAPCDSEVLAVKHTPGSFMAAYKNEASWKNENTAMLLQCAEGERILVRQVAGFIARRTVCRVAPGAKLSRGERYGMIKFSSRLDVYLPPDVELAVTMGQNVKAGETVLARKKAL